MREYYKTAKNSPLFEGIAPDDFERVLNCLSAKTAAYPKEGIILLAGDTADFVGLVLSGSVQIIKEDRDGHSTIVTELGVSALFGEVFACAGVAHSPVTVRAAENAEILLINYKKMITTCAAACPFHAQLIQNMLQILSEKCLMLNQKIEILARRTTREKLLAFLSTQRGAAQTFTIPYNREQLAQYLCVDRSALSAELGKMRDEGLIRFHKSTFEVLDPS